MQIQTNTDHSIEHSAALSTHVETVVKDSLSRFSGQVTRVVVHLSETNNSKSSTGNHRCVMEARLDGHQPIAATGEATSLHQAIQGAAEKLKRSLGSTMGRLNEGAKGGSVVADAIAEDRGPED